jgi:hypothetical protein
MGLLEYHYATTDELLALTNKVRNLVTHWSEDGRYKEAVLKSVIRRFLPEQFIIGTGFVVKPTDTRGEHVSSRQIDLMMYDSASPVLFKEGDFVILTPDAVRGIIEVKANLQNQNIREVVQQANVNGEFIYSAKSREDKRLKFFNGIFSYEGYEAFVNHEVFAENFKLGNTGFRGRSFKKFKVNHVCLNKDWFIKYWEDDELPHSVYNIYNLSFPFFIANLLSSLANESIQKNNAIWFARDKEPDLQHAF